MQPAAPRPPAFARFFSFQIPVVLWTWLAFGRPFRRSALKDWPIDKPVAPADLWPATKVEMRRFGFTMPMLVAEDGTVNPGAVARKFGVSIAQIRKLFDAS